MSAALFAASFNCESSTFTVEDEMYVVEPSTVRLPSTVMLPLTAVLPVTVRLFGIVTLSASPTVTAAVSEPEPDTLVSLAVAAIVAT